MADSLLETKDNIFILESIVKVASRVFDVPYFGVSSFENDTSSLLAGYIDNENDISGKYIPVVLEKKLYVHNAEGVFFAGVIVSSTSQVDMVFWIADLKQHRWNDANFEALQELSDLAAHLISSSHTITDNDANRLIHTQRELVNKNRQLAEANARRKAMLENIGDGVIGIDSKGLVIYLNPSAEKITGWTEAELLGKPLVHSLLLQDEEGNSVPIENNPIRDALYQNEKKETNDTFYVRKDGSRFATAITATPVNIFGQIVGGVNVFRDISIEREIDKMKTEFISLASHQLKTPLASMKWFCEMLLKGDAGELNERQTDFVTTISDSNERLIELVNTLLNISRIESGRLILDPEEISLADIVVDVVKELEPKLRQKGHEIVIDIKEELPSIMVDPKLIRHVFMNLCTNAIKYSPDSKDIELTLELVGESIRSSVKDFGLGIPEKQQGNIFKKFFRADNVTSVETDGSGLGLYLAKQIVEKSGGEIGFKSIENEGTTFWFTIPLSGSVPIEGDVSFDV